MTSKEADLGAYVDQTAALQQLEIDPKHRPGVLINFQVITRIAAVVMNDPDGEREEEPGPVFVP